MFPTVLADFLVCRQAFSRKYPPEGGTFLSGTACFGAMTDLTVNSQRSHEKLSLKMLNTSFM